jgi:hypothetical protein
MRPLHAKMAVGKFRGGVRVDVDFTDRADLSVRDLEYLFFG